VTRSSSTFAQGVAHHGAGRLDAAERCYRLAIAANVRHVEAHFNLGVVLQQRSQLAAARHCFLEVVKLRPRLAAAHHGLGLIAQRLGEASAAETHFCAAIAANRTDPAAHDAYGALLREQGRVDESKRAFDTALSIAPGHKGARFGRGFVRLLSGDLPGGWEDYEFRPAQQDPLVPALQPRWRGEGVAGKTILLHAEQGIGDSLQFLRYAPMLAARGAKVVAAVPVSIMALARRVPGVEQVLEPSPVLPRFDWCCPLPSLPFGFGTALTTVPRDVPYLSAPPERLAAWRARISASQGKFKVALVWAGHPGHPNDHRRSLRFDDLAPLLENSDCHFCLLQKGPSAADAAGVSMDRLGEDLADFADTAAAIAAVDLVISVDTAVCHLAGALGAPVWTLLPFAPDWRWLLDRTDSPWYPTMTLYRQQQPGDWAEVIARVGRDLRALVQQARDRGG
jgi:hypothetical protein